MTKPVGYLVDHAQITLLGYSRVFVSSGLGSQVISYMTLGPTERLVWQHLRFTRPFG